MFEFTEIVYNGYIPPDNRPFYFFVFMLSIIVLLIGYLRIKFSANDDEVMDSSIDMQQLDVLGQPKAYDMDLHNVDEKILLGAISNKGMIQ